MTIASIIKTIGKALTYTGQSMLYIKNLGFFTLQNSPNPFQLWSEDLLIQTVTIDLFTTVLATCIVAIISGTTPFIALACLLVAQIILLVGLLLSHLGQTLEENNRHQSTLVPSL